jgi:hypothetical protein
MMHDTFNLAEAVELIDRIVTRQENTTVESPLDLGVISGVLTLNEEIEVAVKFADRIEQFTKDELFKNTRLIDHDTSTQDVKVKEESRRESP